MTTKARYIEAHQAPRVATALREAGYSHATPELCTEYAINVARRVDQADQERVQAIIDTVLDGYALDREGYGYDAR